MKTSESKSRPSKPSKAISLAYTTEYKSVLCCLSHMLEIANRIVYCVTVTTSPSLGWDGGLEWRLCLHTHTHTHARTHAHTLTHTRTHAHTHTHARTHAHTHTHTQLSNILLYLAHGVVCGCVGQVCHFRTVLVALSFFSFLVTESCHNCC